MLYNSSTIELTRLHNLNVKLSLDVLIKTTIILGNTISFLVLISECIEVMRSFFPQISVSFRLGPFSLRAMQQPRVLSSVASFLLYLKKMPVNTQSWLRPKQESWPD